MTLGIELKFTMPRDTSTVPRVRHILTCVLTELAVTEECRSDIELAITEACANVVEHATSDGDAFDIEVHIDEHHCQIRVLDVGHGFNPTLAESYPGPEAEGGRGLLLMQALMDSLTFESEPGNGTVVRLVKELAFR